MFVALLFGFLESDYVYDRAKQVNQLCQALSSDKGETILLARAGDLKINSGNLRTFLKATKAGSHLHVAFAEVVRNGLHLNGSVRIEDNLVQLEGRGGESLDLPLDMNNADSFYLEALATALAEILR